MAVYDRQGGFVPTIAPGLEGLGRLEDPEEVGEQGVLDSDTIESDDETHAGSGSAPAPTPTIEVDENIGQVIHDRYRLVRQLGRGGMGTVYMAEHATLPKTFAVKLLNARYASRREFAARFLLEAQAVSLIDHPNVVGVVDFGTTHAGATFLVMEHLRGEPLKALCRREGALPWPRVRHLMVQVCQALQAAHAAGIIHRDIKPDNVLRTTQGQDEDFVKVLDFGLAKIQAGEGLRLTRTGMVLGTPEYMAPEQARGSKIDSRVDIYAAGILYYELLCGRTPFHASNFMAMRNLHLLSKPERPSHWAPAAGISVEMDAIALRALAKDPDHRFGSMAEMADAIEAVGQGRGPVALLERDTKPFGLSTASMIVEQGRLAAKRPRTDDLPMPAMDWARKPVVPTSSVGHVEGLEPVRGRRPWLMPTLGLLGLMGMGIGVAVVFVIASSRVGDERPSPTITVVEPEPAPGPITIRASEPAPKFVSLTLDTNVPVRVLEARDQAIVGDTRRSATIALPRSSTSMALVLRAEGFLDLAFDVTPDRDRKLIFTLEAAPSVGPSRPRPGKTSGAATNEATNVPTNEPTNEPDPQDEAALEPSSEPDERTPSKDPRFAPEIRDPWDTPR